MVKKQQQQQKKKKQAKQKENIQSGEVELTAFFAYSSPTADPPSGYAIEF